MLSENGIINAFLVLAGGSQLQIVGREMDETLSTGKSKNKLKLGRPENKEEVAYE